MNNDIIQYKVKLPKELVGQISETSDVELVDVLRLSVARYLQTYAAEKVMSELISQYVERAEGLFEERFDKITNLLASLSYVSKFNNNILNAIFVNNNGSESDLERFYNEATDTVQKYFQFDETEGNILPIMEENDQLRIKVQELEKRAISQAATAQTTGGGNTAELTYANQLPDDKAALDLTIKRITEQIKIMEQKKAEAERQKREVVVWINGLITHLVNNYSRLKTNEQIIRAYIKRNPKPKIQ
ncbi:hypothetical protein SAMN05444392_101172 [Seinonella peptonophila]|uniref:Uncharacterized protein n=1 Tax=Seinonella peptonophila TaxID=112248 RepID=A0A1M4SW83_9BACL|nr:hypothetical protein [Seinonella peptonophila]SHE36439.1 hypothetical protein SAMN05444392_101172 [Seinonella peptonophila]